MTDKQETSYPAEPADYEARVAAYEAEGICRSDAQAIVDADLLNS